MLPALWPRRRLLVASLRRLLSTPTSSVTGESNLPVDAAAMAAAAAEARVVAATRARAEAHKQVQNFDWSSGTDWKTAANIQAQGVRVSIKRRSSSFLNVGSNYISRQG